MISVSGHSWEEISINNRIIEKIKSDYGFSNILSKILVEREFSKIEIDTIHNELPINNPFLNNPDFEKAIKIINEAINKKSKILIIGDYDVDGCVSTSLLKNFFKLININADFYIPNRFNDGYGASLDLIKKLIKKKPDLVIMLDCGSNSVEAVNYLKKNKTQVIIIDHHEIYKPYPNAECLINPKKNVKYKEFDYLCTAALVYFIIDYYIKKKKLNINFEQNLTYVLLATVCDVMPLRKINRILALKVLKKFDIKKNFLFDEIFKIKKFKRLININDFSFLIGPILNSAGRITDANIVVDLLTSNNLGYKKKIINKLILTNEKRKKIENNSLKEINLKHIMNSTDNVIIEYKNILNEGLIGIIASKLKDYFNKPSIVLTKIGNNYKASARSTKNFNIGLCIKKCIDNDLLINGGGHNLAAGFTIKKSKILDFKAYINKLFDKKNLINKRTYISKISLSAINTNFLKDIQNAGPFGFGNTNPVFLLENIRVIKPKILKNKFVSFFAKSKSSTLLSAISFNLIESAINKEILFNKNEISLLVQINENFWNNKKNLQLVVVDVIS